MTTTAVLQSKDGLHFAIPEGTSSITQPDPERSCRLPFEEHDSWKEWGVDKREVASVMIPTSVTCIGRFAFDGCSSLTRVAIPTSVTSINMYAFKACSSLTSVAIPASVTFIEQGAFQGCTSLASVEIPASVTTLGGRDWNRDWHGFFRGAFEGCISLVVLMVQPTDTNDDADADATTDAAARTAVAAITASTSAIVNAFNKQTQFSVVNQIWATDDVIAGLEGRFARYTQFKDVPRALRAAPDAKTWAGVQLWLWWLPPSPFARSCGAGGDDDRVVCARRVATIWTTMLSAYKSSEVLELLPDLEPELWEHIFTFVKHDQQPTFCSS